MRTGLNLEDYESNPEQIVIGGFGEVVVSSRGDFAILITNRRLNGEHPLRSC
jgi:hypothetical protein